MTVDRTASGQLFYEYRTDTGPAILRPEDVLHIPGLGFDGLIGYSPIAMAKNAIGMAIACEEYGASFFANGANPGGVHAHPQPLLRKAFFQLLQQTFVHPLVKVEMLMPDMSVRRLNNCLPNPFIQLFKGNPCSFLHHLFGD